MPRIVETDKPFPIFSIEADKDYLLARAMNFAGSLFHGRAGYCAHQACEKYLKALSLQAAKRYLESHVLPDLGAFCEHQYDRLKEPIVQETLKLFDKYEQVGRYGAAANFDPQAQMQGPVVTAGVMIWVGASLQRLDRLVFEMRSLLDFSEFPGQDGLKAILDRDKTNFVGKGWNLRPPLRVILTKDNKYFK